MVYLLAGSTSAILINFGKVALSYLLSPGDVGVVGMAYTVAVFIQIFEQGGVGDLLIQRKAYRGWAVPGSGSRCCSALAVVLLS